MFIVDRQIRPEPLDGARGRTLASLDSCDLRDRFYSWREASGRRFVCSIFRAEEEGVVALFSQAVVIGVAREGAERRPVCVLAAHDFETPEGRSIRADALTLGANEWHVHFGADDDARAIARTLLN